MKLGPWLVAFSLLALAVPATADICNGPCGRGGPGSGVSPGSSNPPRISISDGFGRPSITSRGKQFSVFEGDYCYFNIHRTKPRNKNSSVHWKTKNGSAIGGVGGSGDYEISNGIARFNSERPSDIEIGVKTNFDQDFKEGPETFSVVLFNPVNGTVADASGSCTIHPGG